ncbi:hypothetical protein KIPB_007004, partial [Kipferlia bialata]
WVVKQIASLYRARQDSEDESEPFPDFVLSTYSASYGLSTLARRAAADLALTALSHEKTSPRAALFVSFLGETSTTDDLTFYIYCKAVLESVLPSAADGDRVPARTAAVAARRVFGDDTVAAECLQLLSRRVPRLVEDGVTSDVFLLVALQYSTGSTARAAGERERAGEPGSAKARRMAQEQARASEAALLSESTPQQERGLDLAEMPVPQRTGRDGRDARDARDARDTPFNLGDSLAGCFDDLTAQYVTILTQPAAHLHPDTLLELQMTVLHDLRMALETATQGIMQPEGVPESDDPDTIAPVATAIRDPMYKAVRHSIREELVSLLASQGRGEAQDMEPEVRVDRFCRRLLGLTPLRSYIEPLASLKVTFALAKARGDSVDTERERERESARRRDMSMGRDM